MSKELDTESVRQMNGSRSDFFAAAFCFAQNGREEMMNSTYDSAWDCEEEETCSPIRVLEEGDGWTRYINHRTEEIETEQHDVAFGATSFSFPASVHYGK